MFAPMREPLYQIAVRLLQRKALNVKERHRKAANIAGNIRNKRLYWTTYPVLAFLAICNIAVYKIVPGGSPCLYRAIFDTIM